MNTLWGWGRASWAGCGPDVRLGGQTLLMGYSADKSPLIGHLAGPLRRLEPLVAQRQEKCGPNRPTPTGYSCNNALLWHHTSRRRGARGRLRVELIDLIQAMATANGLWGAERIRGELLKLGIRVRKRTVQQYMRSVRPRGQHGQTWGTFLRNHTHDIWACDFLQLYDAWFRPIYAFFLVAHGTREVVHVHVTRSPTDAWVAQQLREATPYDSAPRFLIQDNDGKFGRDFAASAWIMSCSLGRTTYAACSPNGWDTSPGGDRTRGSGSGSRTSGSGLAA